MKLKSTIYKLAAGLGVSTMTMLEPMRAADVIVTITDYQGQAVTNARCVATCFSIPSAQAGSVAVITKNSFFTDANGVFTISNAIAGNWQVQPQTNNAAPFAFTVPLTNATLRAENLLSVPTNSPLLIAWTAAADARYARVGVSATATNLDQNATNQVIQIVLANGGVTNNGNFHGVLIGNGAGLTNLTGSTVATALGTNNAFFMSGAFVNQQNPSGDCWGNYKLPAVRFVFSPYPQVASGVATDNETTMLATLSFILNTNILGNGESILTAITNTGTQVEFFSDIGWDGRRNFNPAYQMTNAGSLTTDSALFPHGFPWMVNVLASNGIAFGAGIYAVNQFVPSGASGLCCAFSGSLSTILPYTNGVGSGFIYTNNNYKVVEISTAEHIAQDITQLEWWGLHVIVHNDFEHDPDDIYAIERLAADALQKATLLAGFNPVLGDKYGLKSNFDFSQTNNPGWAAALNGRSYYVLFTNPAAYFPYEAMGSDMNVYGNMTRKFHNGVTYENYNVPVNGRQLINFFFHDFPGALFANQGAYVMSGEAQAASANFAIWGMISAVRGIDCVQTNYIMNCVPALTNAAFNAVINDPLQALPKLVSDFGVGQGTVWMKQLFNGDVALMVNSEAATNGWCPRVTWDMLGLNTNDYYTVIPIYGWSDFSTWFPGQQPITRQNGLINDFSINLFGASIVRLHKAFAALSSVLFTNVVSTNNSTSPLYITLPAVGTYKLILEASAIGNASTDFPTLIEWITNGPSGVVLREQTFNGPQVNGGWIQAIECSAFTGIPLAPNASNPWGGVVNGYTPIGEMRPYNGNSQKVSGRIESTILVTNAPVTIFAAASTATTTNTLYMGSTLTAIQIK